MAKFLLCGIIFLHTSIGNLVAQCTGPVPEAPGPCSGTLLVDGTSIATGQNYYYDGPATTFSNVSISGGTLRICGSLSILNLNFNSGNLIVEPTGVFAFGQDMTTYLNPNQLITNYGVLDINQNYNLNSNCYIVNFGTLNLNTPTIATGNAVIVNQTQANFNMNANDLQLNCLFINKGQATFRNMVINSSGSICMTNGSGLVLQDITNNRVNSVTVESGTACLSYSGQALMNGVLSPDANLIICRVPGSQDPSPSDFGEATVLNPCVSCQQVLPVELISISVSVDGNQSRLKWESALEENLKEYIVESSTDGQRFLYTGRVAARGQTSTYDFPVSVNTKTFFRLKMVDIDGRFSYSRVLVADPEIKNSSLSIAPNPVVTGRLELRITSDILQQGELLIMDNMGRVVNKRDIQIRRGATYLVIPVANVPSGTYWIAFKNSRELFRSRALILNRSR